MAHLLASPFHKPSPAEIPRPTQLPTPPETDTDFHLNASQVFGPHAAAEPESLLPAPPIRRVSTLSYHSTPLRDFRERSRYTTKWLIVAIPPPTISKAHGNFGHTLASGPANRVSQGILVPLFPTLYGQLTAIAREFNFPSSVGLCLYLQVTEQGFTMTPRISDETWPVLWNHLFEARSPSVSMQQLPICGRVEFDIDLNKARWYDSWIASERRHVVDPPASIAPSISHWRADSKTSFVDDQPGDDHSEYTAPPARTRPPGQRHVPRKLSLLDKFEAASVVSGMMNPIEAPEMVEATPGNSLTPIQQEDEPKTATHELETRVKSWRASSSVAPTPMAATGQMSLDPVHMPNNLPLPEASACEEMDTDELDLDDFAWSVSSLGPAEYEDLETSVSWSRVSSVHLDRRVEGSVLLSPSTATSWGPDDDGISLASSVSRLPSPDLAWRALEDVPLTPSTATSWGAPLSYPPSPMAFYPLPSPDIAQRVIEDVPPTPSTATSWGAPLSFPPSPAVFSRPSSPDVGHRTMSSMPTTPLVYPYFTVEHSTHPRDVSELVFPYFSPGSVAQDGHSYPWFAPVNPSHTSGHVYPYFTPRSPASASLVWPSFRTSERTTAGYPFFDLYPAVTPATRSSSPVSERAMKVYPALDIYPVAYPHFEIYPGHVCVAQAHGESLPVHLARLYPGFNLYPVAYPNFEIYPGHMCIAQEPGESLSVRLVPQYPGFDLYPAVYPDFKIYPGNVHLARTDVTSVSVRLATAYPYFDIYPSVYPALVIYPSLFTSESDDSRTSYIQDIYPAGKVFDDSDYYLSKSVRLNAVYPVFELYPALYPCLDIYSSGAATPVSPALTVHRTAAGRSPARRHVGYPDFDLYPPVATLRSDDIVSESSIIRLDSSYPTFNIYPAVYPHFNIYPSVANSIENHRLPLSTRVSSRYPIFCLFPAIYPHFEIYPGEVCNGENQGAWRSEDIQLEPKYPYFDLYPAVYPHFDIYRSGTSTLEEYHSISLSVECTAVYPAFNLYSAIYPYFELYPSVTLPLTRPPMPPAPSISFVVPAVEASVSVEASISVITPSQPRPRPKRTHKDLHEAVFGADPMVPVEVKRRVSFEPTVQSSASTPSASTPSRTRSRSGTVSMRPASTFGRPMPPMPSGPSPQPRIIEPSAPPPRRVGLPSHPAALRSSARPVSAFIPPTTMLSPVEEKDRAKSATLQRSNTQPSHKPSTVRARDSMVLERAKMFDSSSSRDHHRTDAPVAITMSALAEFPLPPVPPVPQLPTTGIPRPVVTKLDRSKYPFA
ncbi:hypothetical protein BV25DRAFT_1895984 [Artomyces pyxidatus]|uniref:Uncharacterized protein n=1 Tax=Artomyces pyxidatus TaxID=48021 RepID=A0ACB8TK50_9AGAM|nr:hypothetical protein BV25DRAFT_1895984 [Artomyces pyxidatus]